MNVPEITNEIKSTQRVEDVAPAYVADKQPPGNGDARAARDAVQKHSAAQGDRESQTHSREALNQSIEDAEAHLVKHDVKLKFNVLEENDTVQVEIVDPDGKTIRKIPDDEFIKLSKSPRTLSAESSTRSPDKKQT